MANSDLPLLAERMIGVGGDADDGLGPLITGLCLFAVISGLFEALTGSTPGKLMFDLRTASGRDGGRASVAQCAARSLVKAFCPPVAALYLSPAGQGSGGLFGTVVVIDHDDHDDPMTEPPG